MYLRLLLPNGSDCSVYLWLGRLVTRHTTHTYSECSIGHISSVLFWGNAGGKQLLYYMSSVLSTIRVYSFRRKIYCIFVEDSSWLVVVRTPTTHQPDSPEHEYCSRARTYTHTHTHIASCRHTHTWPHGHDGDCIDVFAHHERNISSSFSGVDTVQCQYTRALTHTGCKNLSKNEFLIWKMSDIRQIFDIKFKRCLLPMTNSTILSCFVCVRVSA